MNLVPRVSEASRACTNSDAPRAVAPRRLAIAAALALAALAAVTGCSSSPPAAPSAQATPIAPAATTAGASHTAGQGGPAVAAATPSPSPTPTSPAPSAPATPVAQPPGPLTAKITILDTETGLVPGGSAVRFMVTVTNASSQTYSNVLPLVSLGHCACTSNTLFPAGTLQERESTSDVWQTIPYDVEGFGTDYLDVTEPGGIQMISPGATASFEYRVALNPATSAQVTRGMAAIDVTLIALPGHAPIGHSPAASAPVDVQSGQPPA